MKALQTPRIKHSLLRIAIVCSCLAATLAAGSGSAQTVIPDDIAPFEVVYDVGNNLIKAGTATLSLKKDGDSWIYSLRTKPTGVFKLTGKGSISEFSIIGFLESGDSVKLQPQRYSYRQDEEKRRSVDAWFDWKNNTLRYERRGKQVTESFTDPVLDRLSATLVVMNALRSGFNQTQLQVFDNGRIKAVDFINEGNEVLNTPLGKIETIRVVNQNASGSSRTTITWFAPSLDYVPVKIEHLKRDELVARLSLTKLDNRLTRTELENAVADNQDQVTGVGKPQ